MGGAKNNCETRRKGSKAVKQGEKRVAHPSDVGMLKYVVLDTSQ